MEKEQALKKFNLSKKSILESIFQWSDVFAALHMTKLLGCLLSANCHNNFIYARDNKSFKVRINNSF